MKKSINVQETSDVRLSIDILKLEKYLQANLQNLKLPLEVRQFKFGQSNPTYLLIDANKNHYVLRKKPPGQLLSTTAHAVEREFRILDALSKGNTQIPVPKVYLLCRVFEDIRLLSLPREVRNQCWYLAIETLAKLHKVDYISIGLESYGRSSKNFYSRQINSLLKITKVQAQVKDENGNQVGPLPKLDEIIEWFKRNEIKDETSIVHGDYRIDNLIFHSTETKVIGIIDWELSTIGHPLSDLASLLLLYYIKDTGPFIGLRDIKDLPIPTVNELIKLYCEKLAVIAQGLTARIFRKQSSSAEAKLYLGLFKPIMYQAYEFLNSIL
ncbi:7724_t:CDS:2 [Diversispora eburnea]|uniref:7724_t:CDS:1 n=1 Tax=Diversispora eburnea TaxID=1213867 RepID=A0A9N9FSD6_9GLOM|nr:7724_t:CDS:2 [Diversispora eburnea]